MANNYFYIRGGSERVFFDEINMLEKKGHRVAVFSTLAKDNYVTPYDKYFIETYNNKNINIKNIINAFNFIYNKKAKANIKELIYKNNINICHLHNIYGRLTTSIIDGLKEMNVPTVITLHDYKLICPAFLMLNNNKICCKCLYRKYYNCIIYKCHNNNILTSTLYALESYYSNIFNKYNWISYYLCPSIFICNKLKEAGYNDRKIIHIKNFIKAIDYNYNYNTGNYIMYVGRLSKEKGIYTLIKAFKYITTNLIIVGDGYEKDKYISFAQKMSNKNIYFIGYKSGEELKNMYLNCAFTILPSECYENSPITILESYAHGKPVIASKIGGIPELIIDHETGLLFEPGNVEDLISKIEYLIKRPLLISKMGENARKYVIENHSEEEHYNRLISIYNNIL